MSKFWQRTKIAVGDVEARGNKKAAAILKRKRVIMCPQHNNWYNFDYVTEKMIYFYVNM